MVPNIVDAGVKAIFGQLLTAVWDEIKKANNFQVLFKRLELRLKEIGPLIIEIEELDRRLGRSDHDIAMTTSKLQEGLDLVRECAKVWRWDYIGKNTYAKRLEEFKSSLLEWAQINLQLRLLVGSNKILLALETNREGGDDENKFVGGCGAPGGPDFLLRLDELELKGKLLDGGCGAPVGPDFLMGLDELELKGNLLDGGYGASGAPDFLVGLDEPLRELKARLLDGGGQQVVVLSAPRGCGKTTLAKKLCRDEEIKRIFKDNIFFATFSKTPKLMVIVREIFQHQGYQVREFLTDEDAINQLERMLKQLEADHILLVLDDVCPESEFFIEALEFNIPGYKILVTSRSKIDRFYNYELKLLDDHDAMALFNHSAFPQDGNSCIPYDLVKRIAKGCGGFPLALRVVGQSLRGRPVAVWNDMLTRWSEGQSIVYSKFSDNQLLRCLQTSIDALNEMEKEYYMDLAAFPEDQRIAVAALIDMWAELYNLNEDGEAAFSNLYEFSCQNLVNLILPWKDESEINGYYNEHSVMQHDLLRDIAIHESEQTPTRLIMHIRGNDLSRVEQMQDPVHARFVSISTDAMFSGNWCNMQLPAVEVLVLNFQTRNYALPHSVEQMDQVKALIITNYGFCSAEISNFPLVGKLSSLKRIRLERISVSCITDSILQLKNLRKLSLVMCKIDEAFQECAIQIPNLMPNLVEIVVDYCNDLVKFPEWLCYVNSLQKLSITNCHEFISLPEGFGNLGNLKVLRLQSCTKLSELPESVGSLQKLGFLDISDCISISKLPERMGELCDLRKLNMRGCCGLSELPYTVKDLKRLEDLICDDQTVVLWEHYRAHLTNLRLKVLNVDANLDGLLGTSTTIQVPGGYQNTLNTFENNMSPESQSSPPGADVALWRTKELIFTVLTVATATWVALENYQFITLASWVIMFVVISAFLSGNILRLFNKEPPNLSGLEISEESAVKMASSFRTWMEEIVRWMFRVGAEGDWFVFAGTVAALWLASLIGGCFDFLTLLYMGIVVGMSVPAICAKYEHKIKGFGEKVRMQGKTLYTMLDEKVLGKMNSKVAGEKKEKEKEKEKKTE